MAFKENFEELFGYALQRWKLPDSLKTFLEGNKLSIGYCFCNLKKIKR
ncbi:MAG: hypothetical protein HUJ74_00065 [Lachnospiraceae bacterium]|nr:hypothetical protein [Lachnospiraceae bacterium]